MRIGNAPCSWGTIENTGGQRIDHERMLDELAATGYGGTELGDWGFMPTEPAALRRELQRRELAMIGSWVTVRLADESYHQAGVEQAVEVARLLAEVGGPEAIINIGDDHSAYPLRRNNTGRIRPEHGLDEAGWQVFVRGAERVAEAVRGETGLRSALHPHGATWVETPDEIDSFLERSDPELLGICFDTGHFSLGGGDPLAGIHRYRDRIWLMHFKDFDPAVLARGAERGYDYQTLVGAGVFSELGRGSVDFPAVLEALSEIGYHGWIVVEQDVLPGMGAPKESAQRNRDYLAGLGL